MSQRYADDLRADTGEIIIPIITAVALVVSGLQTALRMNLADNWSYAILFVGSLLLSAVTWRWRREGRPISAARLFLGGYLLMLALVIFQDWSPGNPLPYFYGVFVIVSSMMIGPAAGFVTWGVSSFLFVGAVLINPVWPLSWALLPPPLVNLLLATTMYLTAVEWQFAVETVSGLHRKVQRRRDELFAIQEELQRVNARLKIINADLDKARQAAETERDLRTRFMNTVSHELRTPLNAIVNFAHILARGGRGPVSDAQADYLARIEQSGFHLLAMLNDLLDMAQIEAGEFKLSLAPADLRAICEEAMTNVRGLVLDKEVLLVRDYPDTWPTIYADGIRVKQALINLLGNAAKYTEKGYIALRVRPDDTVVQIIVEDSGIGIAAEHQETIFQEFRQVDEAVARRRTGTGLGLPITRHLIQRHGGDVSVESEVGRGSRFTMTLPLQATAVSPANGRGP